MLRKRACPTDVNVTVFDTLAGSLGHGLQIIRAAQLAEKGHSIEEIIHRSHEV